MEKLRKSLKAYVIALVLFVALTFALAALVNFTGFRENWTFGSLLVIMSISSLVLGMMEGRIFQKRGLLAGRRSGCFLSCYHSCVGPGTLRQRSFLWGKQAGCI